MEIKYCERVGGEGLFSSKKYLINNVIYTLTGAFKDKPDKYTIEIGENKHIIDELGIYMNHSFEPSVKIQGLYVISLKNIEIGDEICFNYNNTETSMACPFKTNEGIVSGKLNNQIDTTISTTH